MLVVNHQANSVETKVIISEQNWLSKGVKALKEINRIAKQLKDEAGYKTETKKVSKLKHTDAIKKAVKIYKDKQK
jgi:hypothetical protein